MVYCQKNFHLLSKNKNKFKFETIGNLTILPVEVNGVSLSFLFDSGVKETILFATKQDSVPLENTHEVRFSGIGIEEGVAGIMSIGNEVLVGGILLDSAHNLYVINAEELDISSHVGVPINGIIGSKLLEEYMVKIDHIKSKISLFDPDNYPEKITKNYVRVPLTIERSRPYVSIDVDLGTSELKQAKMLVDMGNSDGLLIFPFLIDSFKVKKPNIYDYIGRGFSGVIYGWRNRIKDFDWAGFNIKQPIVSYPDTNAVEVSKLAQNRKGSIGNQVLQHFHVILNYQNKELFLKSNRNFGKPFLINMTGMDIKHDGLVWIKSQVPTKLRHKDKEDNMGGTTVYTQEQLKYEFSLKPIYIISNVRKGSPADKSGLLQDDELVKINGKKVGDLKLNQIMEKLQSKDGKQIRITIRREEKEMNFAFQLEDPIPYKKDDENI